MRRTVIVVFLLSVVASCGGGGKPNSAGAGSPSANILKGARDLQVQADLRNALVTAKVFFTDNGTYGATPAQLKSIEPALQFGALEAADEATIGYAATSNTIVMVERSSSGAYFCISSDTARTGYGEGSSLAAVDSVQECAGASW